MNNTHNEERIDMAEGQKHEELKPCPFCGGGATLNANGIKSFVFHVQCNRCGVSSPRSTCDERAVALWNARAESGLVKELAAVLKQVRLALGVGKALTRKYLDMVEGKLDGTGIAELREVHYHARDAIDMLDAALAKAQTAPTEPQGWGKRESDSGVHGYEISGNTIYIGPMRRDRVKVADITCTIDWDETYTDEAKQRKIRDAERICRGLDRE